MLNPDSTHGGATKPYGTLSLVKTPAWPTAESMGSILKHGLPRPGLAPGVARWRLRNFRNLWRGLWKVGAAKTLGLPTLYGALYLDLLKADGTKVPLGLVSLRVVTTSGVSYLVDGLQSTGTDVSLFKYHGFGTGSNAEAVGNTGLHTELTTEYAVNSTRPTGSQTEASATVYRSVGTLSPDASAAVTEHGLFTATSAGTMIDRTLFTVVNLVSGDSLQATYDLTVAAGG